MEEIIRIQDLTKRYGRTGVLANDHINLSIQRGEIIGVFGPNGAGKTTLVRQISGLLRPTMGSITMAGHDVVSRPGVVPSIAAYYSQRGLALSSFQFVEILLHAGIHRGLKKDQARREATSLIDYFECGGVANKFLYRMSGGERRLAFLLSTFVGHHPVLLLDEPTNELDPTNRLRVWRYLLDHNRSEGTTIVLVTHNVLEAETVIDRVAVVDRGRIVALGTQGELKAKLAATTRIVVTLRPGFSPSGILASAIHVHGQTWALPVVESEIPASLQSVIQDMGMEVIDNFRVSSCSLDDVYQRLTGRVWDAQPA